MKFFLGEPGEGYKTALALLFVERSTLHLEALSDPNGEYSSLISVILADPVKKFRSSRKDPF
jgi:hypothetical protein